MTNELKLPDFLIIGAGKSGTTSLDNYLGQHPEIYMSPIKEPNFFAYEQHKVGDFIRPEDISHFENSITDISSFQALFIDAKPGQIIGEVSNTTLYGKYSIETIKKYVPDAKLIVILRQPAERLYSRYLHLARENSTPSDSFENDIFDKNNVWWERPDLVKEGFYYQHLHRFYDHFDQSQIKVFLYDQLRSDVNTLLNEMYGFLEVDSSFRSENAHIVYNKSGIIKNRFIHRIAGPNGILTAPVKKIAPTLFNKLKKNNFLQEKLNRLRNKNLNRPALDFELKKRITEDIYYDDLVALDKLIIHDINHWYNFKK